MEGGEAEAGTWSDGRKGRGGWKTERGSRGEVDGEGSGKDVGRVRGRRGVERQIEGGREGVN